MRNEVGKVLTTFLVARNMRSLDYGEPLKKISKEKIVRLVVWEGLQLLYVAWTRGNERECGLHG